MTEEKSERVAQQLPDLFYKDKNGKRKMRDFRQYFKRNNARPVYVKSEWWHPSPVKKASLRDRREEKEAARILANESYKTRAAAMDALKPHGFSRRNIEKLAHQKGCTWLDMATNLCKGTEEEIFG